MEQNLWLNIVQTVAVTPDSDDQSDVHAVNSEIKSLRLSVSDEHSTAIRRIPDANYSLL